jgi:hypothetical protein
MRSSRGRLNSRAAHMTRGHEVSGARRLARCGPAQNTHKGGTNAETYISLLSCSASCASYQQLCAIDMER